MINWLLPLHDASRTAYPQMPGNALVKLYLRSRVQEVESGDDFLLWQEEQNKSRAQQAILIKKSQQEILSKQCVQAFLPTYTWSERCDEQSDWQLSLSDVQAHYDQWEHKFIDMAPSTRKHVLNRLHDKNRRLFRKRFPEVKLSRRRTSKVPKQL
jgi:hypothetical protein